MICFIYGRNVKGLGETYSTTTSCALNKATCFFFFFFFSSCCDNSDGCFSFSAEIPMFYDNIGWEAAGKGARAEEDEGFVHAPKVRPTRTGDI